MTMQIYDVDGFVDELAPIHWYGTLADWSEENAGPRMRELVEYGMTLKDDEFISELEHTKFPPDLMPIAMRLLDAAERCNLVVIISGGVV